MKVQGSTFIVTGGSSGLGAGTAERLVEQGANVVIADVNIEAGQAKADSLGERAVFAQTDVTNEASVENAIQTAFDRFGGLQGVVNCAGILVAKKTVGRGGAHDLASFTRVINVNLIGTFNVIRLAAAAMSQNDPTSDGGKGCVDQYGLCSRLRRPNWPSRLFGVEGWRCWNDATNRTRPFSRRNSVHDYRSRHF